MRLRPGASLSSWLLPELPELRESISAESMGTSLRAGREGFDRASCLSWVGHREQCDRKKHRPLGQFGGTVQLRQLESCGRNGATSNCQTLRQQLGVALHAFNSQPWGRLKQEDCCDFKVSTDYLVILSQNIKGGAGEIARWVKSWLCKQEDLSLILKAHMNSWVWLDL